MSPDTDDDIPPLRPIHEVGPLRTQAELHQQWRTVLAQMMGPLGFVSRRLWLLFLEPDDRPIGQVTEIDDIPVEPRVREVDSLMAMCAELQRDDGIGRVAILLSRPGSGGVSESDRRWGRALADSARRLGVRLTPLHLADDEVLVPLTGDDLLATG